ncbi:TIGR03943 family protein [Streptomyces sp. NPDC026673]|uniref:TIGR03943 family putative permease subunit n=1 Tax=Streptomyces sp. NPDC026673 TaxID=3155724 RepID=UPI0033CFE826
MKRNVQILLLLLTGAGLLHITLFTDLYLRYVQPGLRPLLIASAVVLTVLGIAGAARDGFPFTRRNTHDDHHHDHGPDAGQGHCHDHTTGPRIAWLLYVPVLSLIFFAPPALGSYTAGRDDARAASTAAAGSFPALPGTGTIDLSLSEFSSRAVWDTSATLRGRTVCLTGFVTPGEDGTWYLSRLIVSCCAADAQALKVRVHAAPPPPADTWATVTGTWHPEGELGTDSATPALDAARVQRIDAPANPYKDVPNTRTRD